MPTKAQPDGFAVLPACSLPRTLQLLMFNISACVHGDRKHFFIFFSSSSAPNAAHGMFGGMAKAQIPLGSTRLDSTHSTCRAHAFWLCRASRTAQLDSLDTTRSTGSTKSNVSSRVESSQVEFEPNMEAGCAAVLYNSIQI